MTASCSRRCNRRRCGCCWTSSPSTTAMWRPTRALCSPGSTACIWSSLWEAPSLGYAFIICMSVCLCVCVYVCAAYTWSSLWRRQAQGTKSESVCLSVCVYVCLSVCLSVCLYLGANLGISCMACISRSLLGGFSPYDRSSCVVSEYVQHICSSAS